MITAMKGSYSIKELCAALGVSRRGHHAACARPVAPRLAANEKLLASLQAIHAHRHTRCYGSPRLTKELPRAPARPVRSTGWPTSCGRQVCA